MSKRIEQSIYLSKEGIENMKFQFRAYEKSKAGEALTEAEQKVVDRIAQGEKNYQEYGLNMEAGAASVSISRLGLEKAQYLLTEADNRTLQLAGISVEPKTGYAAEFDKISKRYAVNIVQQDYEAAAGTDILTELDKKYQSIREKIEVDYTGDEQKEKISELDNDYKAVLNENIFKPMDYTMKKEESINNLRMKFLASYEKTIQTRGEKAAIREYGDLSVWKEPTAENVRLLEKYQTMSEQLKNLFEGFGGSGFDMGQAAELLRNMTMDLQTIKANNLVSADIIQ